MTLVHRRTVGDTLKRLNVIIRNDDGSPVELSSYTVKYEQEKEDGTVVTAATTTGVTIQPTQTFTASATNELVTANEHGVKENDQIVVASSGTLPTGLAASTRYYAVQVTPNAFSLATLPNGPAIDITGAGSGTHTLYIVGSVQYTFPSAAVSVVRRDRGWFTRVSGSDVETYPANDEFGITIDIVAKGN